MHADALCLPLARLVRTCALLLVLMPLAAAAAQTPSASPATAGASVPMYRGDAAHTGAMPGPGPVGDPEVLWQSENGGVRTSPAVDGSTVYVGALDGFVYALDRETGVERWRFEVGGYTTSPAVSDGIVFASGGGGRLYAIDAETGTEVWSASTDAPSLFSDPTVVDGVLYIGGYDGFVYALDAATGDLVWSVQTGGRVWIAPAVAEGRVYARSDDGTLYALDASNGAERWRATIGWDNESSSPAVADGTVVVGGAGGVVYAFDIATGEPRWKVTLNGIADTSPAVVGGFAYIGATVPQGAGAVHALDLATGVERWRLDVPAGVASSLSVAGGVGWFGDWDGRAPRGGPRVRHGAVDAATRRWLRRLGAGGGERRHLRRRDRLRAQPYPRDRRLAHRLTRAASAGTKLRDTGERWIMPAGP